MITRVRVLTCAVVALVLPVLTLLAIPAGEPGSVAVVGVVAASLIVAFATLHPAVVLPVAVLDSGPPPSAQRRRRGSFLRQSNPDTPGRPRPRAPGCAPA
ncbi:MULTISPECIES: DUF6412 domain-containing protein [Nocardia]|uniref:Uncharacterized protein n=1 Tax=Nocardia vulneris TaxID=1141657 RepID=A0ABR4Z5L2_9NOCA|nr:MULTISPECIES: DUF6412 domain-containing protein [Nocardia]ASF06706.1 hypothetical protein CEQ30_04465 [Nocardia brasiliensis]KIA60618.1 hypothetical protein FG87_36060 [Nocardia vulneris]MBF6125963.1 hypothetical protein [Nocardia brasiliensis]MBF6543029.1 hypothetical protein [Nocardia brasiliensis]SUB48110.1 Uncharacterised protein [Nocardia brasiliensis]